MCFASQSKSAQGEALPSDNLPTHHTRQARSAPAPPTGHFTNYNQAQDGADARNSLTQLLARLLSRKGEPQKKSLSCLTWHLLKSFCFAPGTVLFLSSLTSILLQSAITHAVSSSHHLAFPTPLQLYLYLLIFFHFFCPSLNHPLLSHSLCHYASLLIWVLLRDLLSPQVSIQGPLSELSFDIKRCLKEEAVGKKKKKLKKPMSCVCVCLQALPTRADRPSAAEPVDSLPATG